MRSLPFICSGLLNKTNQEYYKKIIKFVIAYRECLNIYGWEKKIESDESPDESSGEDDENSMVTPASEDVKTKAKELQEKTGGLDFSIVNNAEHLPKVCNEFITIFLFNREEDLDLERKECIYLIRNMCHWLYTENYTNTKVMLI